MFFHFFAHHRRKSDDNKLVLLIKILSNKHNTIFSLTRRQSVHWYEEKLYFFIFLKIVLVQDYEVQDEG